mmetsp:Transcript_33466/g.77130  ORF Transcript_33466/g.77130 Transcript_33466/m.77130 type:complete len:644 (+) Transcript_33466:25-1956(+)
MAPESKDPGAIAVAGAGTEDANGLYLPTGRMWHEAPVFENDRRCMLSREPHKSQKTGETSYGWIIGQDRKPLYAVQSDSTSPPESGWRKFSGLLPIPRIQCSVLGDAVETAALALKEQGNALFAARSYKEAAAIWSRGLSTLSRGQGQEGQLSQLQLQVTFFANRAEALLRLERWEEALADCEAALAIRPTHDKALLRAAVALRNLRRYGDAQEMVQRCLEVDPRHQEAKTLLRELEQCLDGERRQMPARAKAAKEKLRESALQKGREVDFSSIPRAFDAKDLNNKKGFAAFEGYSKMHEKQAKEVPIADLPYHKMGLPSEQVDLMDNFFREIRAAKKQQATEQKRGTTNYELVKNEYRERVLEDQALGRQDPTEGLQQFFQERKQEAIEEEVPLPSLVVKPASKRAPELATDKVGLSSAEKAEIDDLFKGFKTRLEALEAEEEAERKQMETQALEQLHALKGRRKGEPTRFEQAGGELYCWWSLPPGIVSKDVKVQASNGGTRLSLEVKGITIFDRPLFHHIRGDDVLWSLDAGELALTLTKGERNKLWDQLGAVSDIQFDANGKAISSSVPEPMSANDRLKKFKEMVEGDDGHQARYEDLGDSGKQLVDAIRRYEHARATGDQNALALAEHDLEELGRVVI